MASIYYIYQDPFFFSMDWGVGMALVAPPGYALVTSTVAFFLFLLREAVNLSEDLPKRHDFKKSNNNF